MTHAMTAEMFVQHLCAQGLLFSNVVGEHLADNEGELLLHVLMSDLRRWAISTFYNLNDELAVDGLLTILDEALRTGDEAVKNAVAVSFVEDSCPWDSRMAPFIASWPLGLRDEAGRQQSSR